MSGHLILSLDFELMWGVRDHRSLRDYGDAVLGGRRALPALLERFARARIRATWATVGLLFARDRDEMLDHVPRLRPAYADPRLSPYRDILTGIGRNETEDPWHFGRSLLDRVAQTEGQEIGTHTFSHYLCLEPGPDLAAFAADLGAARAIAAAAGHRLRSIVFPRNQISPAHVREAAAQGIAIFRGTPASYLHRPRGAGGTTALLRGLRFADAVVPLAGRVDFAAPVPRHGGIDVPASRFLRPWNLRLPLYSRLHLARVMREMTAAARAGRCYHLWWHPHNMGRDTEANLAQLDALLAHFGQLRDRYGFASAHMADLGAPLAPATGG